MSAFSVAAVFLVLSVGYGFLLKKYGLKGLTCRRKFSKREVFEGEEAELVEVIGNDRPMIVPWLRVESRISANLQFGHAQGADNGYVYHKSLFTLLPYQKITRRHKVRFLRRGAYNIGNASLTAGDAMGMFRCSRDQRMDVPVVVYPKLLDECEVPRPLSRLMGEWMQQRQLQRDPFLINSIRPYRPGDPVRDIHWPATARTGELHVRVHDYSAQTRLLVVLNAQLRENQWDNLPEYEQAAIEREISLAATLCIQALNAGRTAGFAANMPVDEDGDSAVFLPSGGADRAEELLNAFAHLKIVRTLSFNTFLERLAEYSDLDLIVLSCYDSAEIQDRLEVLRQRGNTVYLHVSGGGAA